MTGKEKVTANSATSPSLPAFSSAAWRLGSMAEEADVGPQRGLLAEDRQHGEGAQLRHQHHPARTAEQDRGWKRLVGRCATSACAARIFVCCFWEPESRTCRSCAKAATHTAT